MNFQYISGSFLYPWTLNNFQDLFISGDVDEILSRQALHQLKWCEVKQDVITGDKKFISVNFCQVAIYISSIQFPCHHRWVKIYMFIFHASTSQIAKTFRLNVFHFTTFPKGALWMPLGNLGRALRTDFPVHARPHTFSLPTIYKVMRMRMRITSTIC